MHERLSWRDDTDLRVLVADYRGLDDDGRADLLRAVVATARTEAPDLNVLSFVDPDRSVTRAMHEIGVAAARDVFRPRRTLVALVGVSPSAALQVRGSNQAAGGRAILTFAGEDEAIAYIVRQRGASAGGLADVG